MFFKGIQFTELRKIVILGISGAGKTHLGRDLSKFLGVPLIHYDTLCWAKDWKEVTEDEVAQKLLVEMKKDRWILEGYIQPLAQERMEKADIVLYLDYSGLRATWGGIRRWFKHRGTHLPEMAEGCVQKWSWQRLKVMWTRDERKEIERAIKGFEKKIVRLKSPKDLSLFLRKVGILED